MPKQKTKYEGPIEQGDGVGADHPDAGPMNGDAPPVAKPKETKDERFRRLRAKRLPRACKAIKSVRQLANKASYAYSEAAAQQIIEVLQSELTALEIAFRGSVVADGGIKWVD